MEKCTVLFGLSSGKQPLIHCLTDGNAPIGMDLDKGSEPDSRPSCVKHFCHSSVQIVLMV